MGFTTHFLAGSQHDSRDHRREGRSRSRTHADGTAGARPGARARPGQGQGASGRRGPGRRRRPGRPGQPGRGDGGRHRGHPGQPGRARPGAQRRRQRRPRGRRAPREGHQQGLGRLADRPAPRPGRDRGRPGRRRSPPYAAAVERLHAERPHAGARDRRDERFRLRGRQGAGRHDRHPRRGGGGRRDRGRARPARRKDLLAQRPGGDLQLRRGGGALGAPRPDRDVHRAEFRGKPGRHDRGRRPGARRGDERAGVQPDCRRRRGMGHR